MDITLKPLDQQVIVITGASSGLGLATALEAARRGARVVIAARSEETLKSIAKGIGDAGGQALAVTVDVSRREDLERLAHAAVAQFGRIDTWINDAGTAVYGRLDAVSDADSRAVFETNFWGVVYGSLVALPHLKKQGGALINLGSELSEGAVPMIGMYAASKHAVKGFTDSLRIEVEEVDKAPVAITLIQPTAVDTPFPQHAKNYQTQEAKLPEPQINAEDVAEAILDAAVKHTRDVKVGTRAVLNTLAAKFLPGVADKMAGTYAEKQHYDEPARDPEGSLRRPGESTVEGVGNTRGGGGVEREKD